MTVPMRGASREALEALRETIGGHAGPDVGRELFSVVDLLDQERALRRTLSDASTEEDSRVGLVRALLGGKVSDATLEVLSAAVTQQWSSATDMLDSLELVGREALLSAAQSDGELDTVEDELFRLGRIVASSPGLEQALSDRNASAGRRTELLHGLIDGKVTATTAALVEQVIGRLRTDPADAFDELSTVAARLREQSVAHIRSAVELSDAQHTRLTEVLTRIYGRPVTVHVEVDRSLTGGMVVQVGDEVIDGSISGRIDTLRRRLSR